MGLFLGDCYYYYIFVVVFASTLIILFPLENISFIMLTADDYMALFPIIE